MTRTRKIACLPHLIPGLLNRRLQGGEPAEPAPPRSPVRPIRPLYPPPSPAKAPSPVRPSSTKFDQIRPFFPFSRNPPLSALLGGYRRL